MFILYIVVKCFKEQTRGKLEGVEIDFFFPLNYFFPVFFFFLLLCFPTFTYYVLDLFWWMDVLHSFPMCFLVLLPNSFSQLILEML